MCVRLLSPSMLVHVRSLRRKETKGGRGVRPDIKTITLSRMWRQIWVQKKSNHFDVKQWKTCLHVAIISLCYKLFATNHPSNFLWTRNNACVLQNAYGSMQKMSKLINRIQSELPSQVFLFLRPTLPTKQVQFPGWTERNCGRPTMDSVPESRGNSPALNVVWMANGKRKSNH